MRLGSVPAYLRLSPSAVIFKSQPTYLYAVGKNFIVIPADIIVPSGIK